MAKDYVKLESLEQFLSVQAKTIARTYSIDLNDIPALNYQIESPESVFAKTGSLEAHAAKHGVRSTINQLASLAVVYFELTQREGFQVPYKVGSMRKITDKIVKTLKDDDVLYQICHRGNDSVEELYLSANQFMEIIHMISPGIFLDDMMAERRKQVN